MLMAEATDMDREALLAAGVAVLLVASAVTVVVVPGVVADRDPGDLRPSYLDVQEVTLATGDVSEGTVTLSVTAYLDHRGGDAENVSLQVRAVDLESGLVEATREVSVGRLSGDREEAVPVNVTVAREGGYRIDTVLYEDGDRRGVVSKKVRGVGTVQAGGQVAFHRFEAGLPAVQYAVADAAGNRTALDVSTYLTNVGAEPSDSATVELVVRQAESNIVAARTTVSVDEIAPGETVTPGATVTVPAGYNYYLDAVLRKDGVIVDTARSAANLDPEERIEADTTVRDVGLQVEDFERTEEPDRPEPDAGGGTGGGVPGFGPAAAVGSVVAAAIIARRRGS